MTNRLLNTHRIPGMVLVDHFFDLPLDYANPGGPTIPIYAREVVDPLQEADDLPWLVFFQGGPGFGAPRPMEKNGWLKRALQEYRVLLLDQRGTGRSSPVNQQTLARFKTPQEQATYLAHFRADSIVADAEAIRLQLLGAEQSWSLLGQSYGGFCILAYLSAAPQGLKEVFITGGIPSLTRTADEVYMATYRRVRDKNEQYYQRYPGDQAVVRQVVVHLSSQVVLLPSGDRLTPHRFQQLGLAFGASDGFEQIHYLLEGAFVEGVSGPELSYTFLHGVEHLQTFNTNPIFALLHEAIYCQQSASNWSAHRIRSEFPGFDIQLDQPIYFTGEMIYPWMFDEYRELRPLKEAAEILARYDEWPDLYNLEQLSQNQVPGAAAVYYDDMYVERLYSEETLRAVPGIRAWVTNQYEHNGLRADGEAILDRLIRMVRGDL